MSSCLLLILALLLLLDDAPVFSSRCIWGVSNNGLGIIISLMNITFIVGLRDQLPFFFTFDKDLITKAKDLFLVVALYQLPDGVNCVEQGIFRAIGRQSLAAELNFIAYYIIGIPVGYVLGIPFEMGADGLWIGMTVGMLFVSIVNTFIILRRCDWEQLSLEARKRLSIHAATEHNNGDLGRSSQSRSHRKSNE